MLYTLYLYIYTHIWDAYVRIWRLHTVTYTCICYMCMDIIIIIVSLS